MNFIISAGAVAPDNIFFTNKVDKVDKALIAQSETKTPAS
jgi:hypothetical protein